MIRGRSKLAMTKGKTTPARWVSFPSCLQSAGKKAEQGAREGRFIAPATGGGRPWMKGTRLCSFPKGGRPAGQGKSFLPLPLASAGPGQKGGRFGSAGAGLARRGQVKGKEKAMAPRAQGTFIG